MKDTAENNLLGCALALLSTVGYVAAAFMFKEVKVRFLHFVTNTSIPIISVGPLDGLSPGLFF